MNIRIFYDDVKYRLIGSRKVTYLIDNVISLENKSTGVLSFVITNDEALKALNVKFLEHDYYTDVIAFNYNEGNTINGEVYLSIDTIKRNAINYKVSLRTEVLRVMIHGVLHLLGYDDKEEKQRIIMKEAENKYLKLFKD